uniref:Uncharacterized protein n=1 Tax=Anguilla anguilla TaxID=7936 RepID=A0A0E9SA11_ANGAN
MELGCLWYMRLDNYSAMGFFCRASLL